jgi:hypothetical protein
MINNLCFNNLELYLDIFVLIQPSRIAIYCNYLMLFTFDDKFTLTTVDCSNEILLSRKCPSWKLNET